MVRKLQQIPAVVCKCPRDAFYLMAALPVDDADTIQQWLLEVIDDHGDTVMSGPAKEVCAKYIEAMEAADVKESKDKKKTE